ncbi:MAG: c-type cytochrome biogenesis protein CcsB [Propionicimonas sp.]
MVTSAVLYLVALIVHSLEWALARGSATNERSPREDLLGRLGLSVTMVAAAVHVFAVVMRGIAAQRAPWGNMYEFITSSLAMAVVIYLVLVFLRGLSWLGLPVTLLAAIGQGLAVTVFYVNVAPLMPALHSVWFVIHIVAAALSGAAFSIGGLAAVLYLLKARGERRAAPLNGYLRRLPSAAVIDRLSYRFHAFALPLWTFTIAAGAIWAQFAWGRFWGWDPKETWSLVTWIVYVAYLHARATAGWKGTRAAVLAVIGLATFWFNFIGVNLLFSGLHSYAGI